jgi:hypothetical protein
MCVGCVCVCVRVRKAQLISINYTVVTNRSISSQSLNSTDLVSKQADYFDNSAQTEKLIAHRS